VSMDGCNDRTPKDSDTEALALLKKKFTELVGVSVWNLVYISSIINIYTDSRAALVWFATILLPQLLEDLSHNGK
jgi:hypothetical protein